MYAILKQVGLWIITGKSNSPQAKRIRARWDQPAAKAKKPRVKKSVKSRSAGRSA